MVLTSTTIWNQAREVENTIKLLPSKIKVQDSLQKKALSEIIDLKEKLSKGSDIQPSDLIKNYPFMLSIVRPDDKQVDQKILTWLKQEVTDLFTWSDYALAYFTYKKIKSRIFKNEEELQKVDKCREPQKFEELKDEAIKLEEMKPDSWRCVEICYLYLVFQGLHLEETTLALFMNHDPYDYTRPQGWYKESNFIGMSEAIYALNEMKAWLTFADTKKDKERSMKKYQKTLQLFQKQYPKYFPEKITEYEQLIIPYEFYEECWNQIQSPETIMKHSIEICYFYFKQRGLNLKLMLDTKLSEGFPANNSNLLTVGWVPCLKFCNVAEFVRIIAISSVYSGFFKMDFDSQAKLFEDHLKSLYKVSRSKEIKAVGKINSLVGHFEWWGIRLRSETFSYRQTMSHFYSFFDEKLNAASLGLYLDSQLVVCAQSLIVRKQEGNPQQLAQIQQMLLLELIKEAFTILSYIKSFVVEKTENLPETEKYIQSILNDFRLSSEVYKLKQILDGSMQSTDMLKLFDDLRSHAIKNVKKTGLIYLNAETLDKKITYAIWDMVCIFPNRRPLQYLDGINNSAVLKEWMGFIPPTDPKTIAESEKFRKKVEDANQKLKNANLKGLPKPHVRPLAL